MSVTWMVTGGAGYIGAHVVREMQTAGIPLVVLDNLSTGSRNFVPAGVPLVEADLLDLNAVRQALSKHSVRGVIHVAGFKFAGVSVDKPLYAYEQNVVGTTVLLRALELEGVNKIVFSSSSSVYGNAATGLITEDFPFNPTSPYGESKVIGEWLLRNQGRATGLLHTSLRYFNVIGSGDPAIPDLSPHNLLSMVFEGLRDNRTPVIFGDDYATPDGTCVRDYVHVSDIARAHVGAAKRMDGGHHVAVAYNLGSGNGTSVAEIMRAIARVTGLGFSPTIGNRRPGDPARVVASGDLAAQDIGWAVRHTLEEMIQSAFEARQGR